MRNLTSKELELLRHFSNDYGKRPPEVFAPLNGFRLRYLLRRGFLSCHKASTGSRRYRYYTQTKEGHAYSCRIHG